MSACDCWASFKFSQIILCLSCLLYKRWSDAEATRLFYYFEKTSREWPLLNNITRNGAGSLFADVTFGGYVIICVALFIAYLMGELKNSKKTESFLLAIGAVLFIGVGCLVMTAVDSVPRDLIVNALVLGTLSIVTGMVFVMDTCLSHRRNDKGSQLSKSTRYGDIARTANGARKSGEHVNGRAAVTTNGRAAATNGPQHANGAPVREAAAVAEKRRNDGLLQTTAAAAAAAVVDGDVRGARGQVETKNESVQTSSSADETDGGATTGHRRYGRKRLDDRGYDGGHDKRHTDWYDTDMDLSKMKKLEINVPDSPADYRGGRGRAYPAAFVSVKNGSVKLQSPSITSTVHQQQESPKEEHEHEVKNARVPYVLSEKKRVARPTDLALKSPVERLNDSLQKSVKSRFYFGANMDEPKSPNDPGYVLHTASRWEEQPQNSYKNFKRSQV